MDRGEYSRYAYNALYVDLGAHEAPFVCVCVWIVYGVKTGGNGVARDIKAKIYIGMIYIQITSFSSLWVGG